jgi:hypothetical protein
MQDWRGKQIKAIKAIGDFYGGALRNAIQNANIRRDHP